MKKNLILLFVSMIANIIIQNSLMAIVEYQLLVALKKNSILIIWAWQIRITFCLSEIYLFKHLWDIYLLLFNRQNLNKF